MKQVSRRQFLFSSSLLFSLGIQAKISGTGAAHSLCPTKGNSTEKRFTTASSSPAPHGMYAPPKGDIRLVVFSDLNSRYGSVEYISEVHNAVNVLSAWEPDMILCAGDMVAGQSLKLSSAQVKDMWRAFDQKVFQPIRAQGLPYAMTLGNHDASNYQDQTGKYVFQVDRQEANHYWANQDLGINFIDKSGFPFYYAFQLKDIFFLVWDASSANVSEQELQWADQILQSEQAQKSRMRIVAGHLPLYAVARGRDRQGEFLYRADKLRALLEKNRVHTYISGHHHVYYPGRVGQLEMLHVGALGSGPRSWLSSTKMAMHTLTVLDIDLESAETRSTTYNMSNSQVVQVSELPRFIVGPNGREIRKDLTISDLSESEKSQQYTISQ